MMIAACLGGAPAAHAAQFDIAAGPLGSVVAAIGARARITVAVTDPELAARPSPGVRGNLSARAALARAIRGTGAEVVFLDSVTVRIVRKRIIPNRFPQQTSGSSNPSPGPTADIIVTASKQNVTVTRYPGSVHIIEPQKQWSSANAHLGSAALMDMMPVLNSTNLGRGRNKIYVRGIADSSFNGPTQSTVGQYFGDVRLNYNAPDPDLNLYDLKRIEVLAGPQGTLYGAGSLGGVVRLVPNVPDLAETYGSAATGVSATQSGGIGADAAAMFNMPIGDRSAVRAVIYGARDAGYIDDPARGLSNINRGRSVGGRLALRREDLAGWTLDVGAVIQNIDSRDSQYVLKGDPPLSRSSTLAQPFRNDYHLAYLVARKTMDSGSELVTATSLVRHELQSVYDATGADGTSVPRLFDERNRITFIAHETRLAGGSTRAPWVVGLSGLYNISAISRTLGTPGDPQRLVGVENERSEISFFGQKSFPIGRSLIATVGGRITGAHNLGRLLNEAEGAPERESGTRFRFAGNAALSWQIAPRLATYAHFQQGFRPGGFTVASEGSADEGTNFAADDLTQIELGLHWRSGKRDWIEVRAAVFGVDWQQIQADIIDTAGFINTANIGNGRIYGLDGEVKVRPLKGMSLSISAFQNDSNIYEPAPGFAASDGTLPNVPRDGIRMAAEWQKKVGADALVTANASLRYVGRSFLGPAPLLDIEQGKYFTADVGLRLDLARVGLSLDVRNVGNIRANTFAFGNPFGVTGRDQITPLRPRTIRLGLDMRF